MRNTGLIRLLAAGALLGGAVSPAFAASCSTGDKAYGQTVAMEKDIVAVAVDAGSFNTLAKALKAADLVGALQGEGPFTVFAPTDDAFAKLPKATLESLLKPENKAKLQAILKYHVVAGEYPAAKVTRMNGAVSLQGQQIDLKVEDGKVMVDNATVAAADVKASNGVIHVIDSVILPESKNIVQVAQSAGAFGTLLKAATEAGLADTLANGGPFTVFAPTDDAFAKLPEGTVASLLKPENRSKLQRILKAHVVEGRVYSAQAAKLDGAGTLADYDVTIKPSGKTLSIDGAKVVTADVDASNGVIHVIDAVIIPDERTARAGY